MKKIAIDILPLISGHSSRGMGVYARRLIENLKLFNQSYLSIEELNFGENKNKLGNYDLIHYPYFDLFYNTLPIVKQTKTVVTIPDVTPLLFPKYYPPGIRGTVNFALQKIALKNINAVVTISETSKCDINKFLGVPKNKIFVTPLASNFNFSISTSTELSRIRKKYNLPETFILYIGDVNWNKNLLRLIEAVKNIDTTLVIVGKSAVDTRYDRSHIENAPLGKIQDEYGSDPNVMRLGFVEDIELNAIWQLASVYCMPSLYEGFGLSVVEAMEAGVPVACSNTPALVETAGDAALYFDPTDVNDMSQKISKLLGDLEARQDYISRGKQNAKKYSWLLTAEKTISVYRGCLKTFE